MCYVSYKPYSCNFREWYYDLKLGSGCNLDKDLSKEVGLSQLVKCKDTGLYL